MKSLYRWLLYVLVCAAAFALVVSSPVQAGSPWNGSLYLPIISSSANPSSPPGSLPTSSGWLDYVNAYRSAADLPPLTEDPSLSDGDQKHAHYMVVTDTIGHNEDINNSNYTPAGATAALKSDLMGSSSANTPDQDAIDAIDMWMQGPFHAIGILDPRLLRTGFGLDTDDTGSVKMAAALDVLSGWDNPPSSISYPVMWPGKGATVSLTSYMGGESPNPLATCGYKAPTGLPIILQVNSGYHTLHVTAHSFAQGTMKLDSCVFDSSTYTGDPTGANILNTRDAIVLIPRAPLVRGKTYTVSITNSGNVYTWSFSIAN